MTNLTPRELALVEAALKAAAEKCDKEFSLYDRVGLLREASTAKNIGTEIRSLDPAAIVASVP